MPLYLSSSVYIFTILKISLLYPSMVGIYRGGIVWGYKIAYNKNPTSIYLSSNKLAV